jgi:DNA-binding beta-propeller fold protein YncE
MGNYRKKSCFVSLLSVVAVSLLFGIGKPVLADEPAIQRLLYVAAPGIRNDLQFGGAGILVFNIDGNHSFVRRIETTASRQSNPENVKGVCASAATGRLYFTTLTRLHCVDLTSDKELWGKALPGGCDRLSITPDGKRLFVPSLEGPHWNVVDGQNGDVVAKIETKSGSHNTVASTDGTRIYCAGLKSPLLTVVDPAKNEIVGAAGPFSAEIRPFTINGAKTRCYVTVNRLLGFEIGDLTTGKFLERVEVKGSVAGTPARHGCPSHGVGLTPDEREIWVCDSVGRSIHIFDNSGAHPREIAAVALREEPGWVTFSIDGRYAYPSTGDVIDTASRKVVTQLQDEQGRPVESEKLLEIDFRDGKVFRTGDQFGIGRAAKT